MALNKLKTDPKLGEDIQKHLEKNNVATPMDYSGMRASGDEYKIEAIKQNIKNIMITLNLDLTDDSLRDTPTRVAKMFVNEIYWGLKTDNFPKITTVENKMHYDEMVIEKNISVASQCEHHLVTIDGKCHIAYIPDKKVLGLSKLNRIVEYFSKRPQIQERLTEQIYHALQYILETNNIAVVIDAIHYCVKSRGVEDVNSSTTTSKLGGVFREDYNVRNEFLNLIRK